MAIGSWPYSRLDLVLYRGDCPFWDYGTEGSKSVERTVTKNNE